MVRKIRDDERVCAERGRWPGVYGAAAVEVVAYEVGKEPKVYGDWREELTFGASLEVPAYLVPKWARPRLEAGRPMPVAVVSPDDRVVFRAETGAEIVELLGL